MLSLLLKEQKHDLKKEYRFRFVNVFLGFILVSTIVWTISLIPSYVFVSAEKDTLADRASVVSNSQLLEDKQMLTELSQELDRRLQIFDIDSAKKPTDIIGVITASQSNNISINSIEINSLGADEEGVLVRGIANDRESLSQFTKNLSVTGFFEPVELPLSNFVKEAQIPFNINLMIAYSDDN